jgi:hypothetical protein
MALSPLQATFARAIDEQKRLAALHAERADALRALMALADTAVRTYRGTPGCQCGCLGRYTEHGPTMRRDIADLVDLLERTDATVQTRADYVAADLDDETRIVVYGPPPA